MSLENTMAYEVGIKYNYLKTDRYVATGVHSCRSSRYAFYSKDSTFWRESMSRRDAISLRISLTIL